MDSIKSLPELTKRIQALSIVPKEQLSILLLWFYDHMNPDKEKLKNGGEPKSIKESIISRSGSCDEYSNIITAFCKSLKIPCFRVEGYVREVDMSLGKLPDAINHAWNAIYLDSGWCLTDFFWCTTWGVGTKNNSSYFKTLNLDYFMSTPQSFLAHHLPADPVFQLQSNPIQAISFFSHESGFDTTIQRMALCNFEDSLKYFEKLNASNRNITTARRAYNYNPNNPNILIIAYFNEAVELYNQKNATSVQLKTSRKYFKSALSLIDKSKEPSVINLKAQSQNGIVNIDKRLSKMK